MVDMTIRLGQTIIKQGDLTSISYLCQNGCNMGSTLCWAIFNKHQPVVEYLMNESQSYHHSLSAVMSAHCRGRQNVIRFIMENSRDVEDMVKDAVKAHSTPDVMLFIQNGADLHMDNDWPLRYAAKSGDETLVRLLVKRGANIHAQDDYAVRWAAAYGRDSVVKYLTKKGANIRAMDDFALRMAAHNGHESVVRFLVENGASPYSTNYSSIRWARFNHHTSIVEFLRGLI